MARKTELGEYLKARRARLTPADVGLPAGERRRVPGLRREELAALAGVSVDYLVRLEQGRDLTPSASVVDALAAALGLDDVERAHLHRLVHATPQLVGGTPERRAVRPGVRLLLDRLTTPAFVVGRRLDLLAVNAVARVMFDDFGVAGDEPRNHARWIFLDPTTRELYEDWAVVARENVAILRRDAGLYPGDAELRALVAELSAASPEFRGWWGEHDVTARSHGIKRYRHPVVGPLTVAYEALTIGADDGQLLYVYSVEAGTASAEAMERLAELALTPQPTAR